MEELKGLFGSPEQDTGHDAFKPAIYRRRVFQLDAKASRATRLITACGRYRAFINGGPVTD